MTSTNLIRQFFTGSNYEQARATSFNPGQIFNGRITKIYPNQMAEVQVGDQRVLAQLETALVQGERYWLQVQPGEGKVHLKVIGNPNAPANSPEDILARLALPQSREMTQIVSFLMKEELPLSKEMLTTAAQWLSQSQGSLTDGLQVIKQVLNQQLPFTPDILSAFMAMRSPQSLHGLMANLQAQLSNESDSELVRNLLANLGQVNNPTSNNVTNSSLQTIVDKWLFGSESEQAGALRLMQSLGVIQKGLDSEALVSRFAQNLPNQLTNLGNLPFEIREQAQLLQELNSALQANNRQDAIIALSQIFGDKNITEIQSLLKLGNNQVSKQAVRALLQNIIGQMKASQPNQSNQQANRLAEQVFNLLSNSSGNKGQFSTVQANLNNLFLNQSQASNREANLVNLNQLTRPEQVIVQSVQQEVNELIPKWENKDFVQRTLTQLIRSLGLNFESNLQNNNQQNLDEALKPLLNKFLAEQPSVNGRIMAEQLLHRLTGIQLQAQESGPLQQILVQVPVQMLNKTTDMTMQWSGRKTEDGKIDPNYCRVLFYLDLENLDETVVDLQVQNRIMNITIFNDLAGLETIAEPFYKTLKDNIESDYYKLSAVSFKQFEKAAQEETRKIPTLVDKSYTGVDFRV